MQSRRQSLIETLAGVAQNASITVIFTVVSILRGYWVRRFFNWLWRTV